MSKSALFELLSYYKEKQFNSNSSHSYDMWNNHYGKSYQEVEK